MTVYKFRRFTLEDLAQAIVLPTTEMTLTESQDQIVVKTTPLNPGQENILKQFMTDMGWIEDTS